MHDKTEAIEKMHDEARFRPGPTGTFDPKARRFVCPATLAAITDAICGASREANPAVCEGCPAPRLKAVCEKCGRAFSEQERRAGFTTCEFCD